MIHDFISEWESYIRKYRRIKYWNQIKAVLMILVVFYTAYALMAPAITMEKKCEIQEHAHSNACYNQITAITTVTPVCTPESLEIHRHEAGCYGEDEQICCGYADFVLHLHDAACYEDNGTLWCQLPEVEEYRHLGSCYVYPEIHKHQESCYTSIPRDLICGLHEHTEDCMLEQVSQVCGMEESYGHRHTDDCLLVTEVLNCRKEETDGHLHDDTCKNEEGELICGEEEYEAHHHSEECWGEETEIICGLEVTDGHRHSDSCIQSSTVLACGIESDHVHTDDCRSITRELTCGQEEPEEGFSPEPELLCGKEEVIYHCHTEQCFNEYQQLTCGQMQVLQHQHSDDCFRVEEVPVDTETLTCTVPEDNQGHSHGPECRDASGVLICQQEETAGHRHSTRCYGTWELICQIPEHAHSEACNPAAETTETNTTEITTEETDPTETTIETEAAETVETIETVPDVMLPEGISDLPVLGYAQAVHPVRRTRMLLQTYTGTSSETTSPDDGTPPVTRSTPLAVDNYITNATLEYQPENSDNWINVNNQQNIPGNATFRFTVEYTNIPISVLQDAGNTLTYTLPAIFREAIANGSITDTSNIPIGTITAEGTSVTIVFEDSWLKGQKISDDSAIKGKFYVKGKINLSAIPGGGSTTITIGNVTISLNLAADLIAQYGSVDIEKTMLPTVLETEDGDYLQYTLKVDAKEYGCPAVSVVDTFSLGDEFLARDPENKPIIMPIEPTDAELVISENEMTWQIGDMDPNETKTLTYQVKLKDAYTGIQSPDNTTKDIKNTATVLSKEYERDTAEATFHPKGKATLSKIGSKTATDSDGVQKITYYIWVHAPIDNNYVLDKVKIVDSLDGKGSRPNPTSDPIRHHLAYDESSFTLYEGGSQKSTDLTGLRQLQPVENALIMDDTDNDGKKNDSFTYYIGSLAPGESKTLVYTLTVDPGVYVGAGNSEFTVSNRAEIFSDDSRNDGNARLEAYSSNISFARKVWSRKLVGSELQQQETISMAEGKVYDTNGDEAEYPKSFVAPAGSYRYQVLANEAGDWDLSSANLHDSLTTYMEFVGYVKVETYPVNENVPASSLSDTEALSYFQKYHKTPCSTFWIPIDQTTSFSISPTQEFVGCSNETCHAFLLTYYAQPVNNENITQTVVNNTFTIAGTVGLNGKTYTNVAITASAGVTVSGSNSFHADKQAWYYDPPSVTSGDFSKGTIYWAIRVEGNLIPAGTIVKDITNFKNGGIEHFIRDSSLVGVYTGNLGPDGVKAYENLDALLNSNKLTPLNSSHYHTEPTNDTLTFTLVNDLTLGHDNTLYILVKTEPKELPTDKRGTKLFYNSLQSSNNGTDWIDHNGDEITIYGSTRIFKELGRIVSYSGPGTELKPLQEGTSANIVPEMLSGDGIYVAWQIHLNYEGTLNGTYRVLEEIPDGMEVAYIRTYWLGQGALSQKPVPESVPIPNPGAGWEPQENTMNSVSGFPYKNYYYIKGQQVLMEYQNLQAGHETDQYAVEIQVVCKVTDPDALLNGQENVFNNRVTLLTQDGSEIGSDTDGVTFSGVRLSKSAGTRNQNNGIYPFVIKLNEDGVDLLPNAKTITLVDELGPNLMLNDDIVVKNSVTNAVLTPKDSQGIGDYSVTCDQNSDNNQMTLRITLPDHLPLTITYSVTVNAPPGKTVTVSNNAHWEGYETSADGSVNDQTYNIDAGGITESILQIRITKIDASNNAIHLAGAKFSLTEMELIDEKELQEVSDGIKYEDTTDNDGKITFGTDGQLQYNTVYRIQETKAPEDYVLNSDPKYILFAKEITTEDGNTAYPDYTRYEAAKVLILYKSSYQYSVPNSKGKITVTKDFTNVDGTPVTNLSGTYRFGLFTRTDEGELESVKTTSIKFKNSTEETASAEFTNIDLNRTYYVYELNDQNQPITGGSGTINGIPFVTSYSPSGAITLTAEQHSASVTVTNQLNYTELPSTGGRGTMGFYILGGLLLSAAALVPYLKKRNHLIP